MSRPRRRSPAASVAVSPLPHATHPITLAIDIGGTGIKTILLDQEGDAIGEHERELTPRPATPAALMKTLTKMIRRRADFDRLSVGFPGVIKDNTVFSAANLDGKWFEFPLGEKLHTLTGKPVRVLNDAGIQGYGIIEGHGVEMVLTFGTGMGTAIYLDGRYVPNLELGHHPFRRGKTYEDLVCDSEMKRIGKKKWNNRVALVISQVLATWNPKVLYLGGGNSRLVRCELPSNVKIADNIAGLLGGIALWRHP